MKFMTGARYKMYGRIPQVKRKMTNSLHGIRMKDCTVPLANIARGMDVEHITCFVVGMHQRNQAFFFACGKQVFNIFHINMPVRQHLLHN